MKKITAAVIAVALIIFTCAVPAFADDSAFSGNMTTEEFTEQYYSLLNAYLEGEIDWSTYNTSSNWLINKYTSDNIGGTAESVA